MSLDLAITDLVDVLTKTNVLDKVKDVKPIAGRPNLHLGVTMGPQTKTYHYGKTKLMQVIVLTLTVKTRVTPATLSDILKKIDDEIVKDRRRNNQAQLTVMDEDGWTPGEAAEDGSVHVLTRNVEVHVYENQI